MLRFAPPAPNRSSVRFLSAIAIAIGLALTTIHAQIPGRNVNMVSGTEWPDGDPFLQRQNEPSIAASTRNPLHLLGGSNDYRTVDLPGPAASDEETGDAWLGLFKSFDGGQRWTSTLLPGLSAGHDRRQASPRRSRLPGRRRSGGARRHQRPVLLHRPRRSIAATERQERDLRRALHRQQQQGSRRSVRVSRHRRWSPTSDRHGGGSSTSRGWRSTFRAAARAGTITTTASRHDKATSKGNAVDAAALPAGTVYVAYHVRSPSARRSLRSESCSAALERLRRDVEHADPRSAARRTASTRARRSRSIRATARSTWRGGASISIRPTARSTTRIDGGAAADRRQAVRQPPGVRARFAEAARSKGRDPTSLRAPATASRRLGRPPRTRRRRSTSRRRHRRLQLPHQRLSDDDGRRHRPLLRGVDGARLRAAAPRPVDGDARIVMTTTTRRRRLGTEPSPVDDRRPARPPDDAVALVRRRQADAGLLRPARDARADVHEHIDDQRRPRPSAACATPSTSARVDGARRADRRCSRRRCRCRIT